MRVERGGVMNPREFLAVCNVLKVARSVKRYVSDDKVLGDGILIGLVDSITPLHEVETRKMCIRDRIRSTQEKAMFDNSLKTVDLYTDGACSGNPGPGGYGAVLKFNGKVKELSGGYRSTTNNRMEILAVIKGLTALREPCNVNVYSDSKYVVDAITQGWVYKWESKGWMRTNKDPALNVDLWEQLLVLLDEHNVEFHWVKGHAGHCLLYTSRCV